MLDCAHWIDAGKLEVYILACQDEDGGFADRPGDVPDPFHTLFGLAALSLLTRSGPLTYSDIAAIHPVYCMARARIPRHVSN